MNQLHIMVFITCLIVKAQINYMWSLEEFKMNENFMCEYFYYYILPVSTQSVYTIPWKYPVIISPSYIVNFFLGILPLTPFLNKDELWHENCVNPVTSIHHNYFGINFIHTFQLFETFIQVHVAKYFPTSFLHGMGIFWKYYILINEIFQINLFMLIGLCS
jgi:hypothetical protein